MKSRVAMSLVAAALSSALMIPSPASAEPLRVGTDPVGDWQGGGDAALVGHAAGQDLLGASIDRSGDAVSFTIEVSYLPSPGGVPEASRYTWDMMVDNTPGVNNEDGSSNAKFAELDGKFTNYSRGACDPTAGKCPPPRDPGMQPFFLRGNCATDPQTNVTTCQELDKYMAVFTPATRTITVTVPAATLGLVPCSTIEGGPNIMGGNLSASPSAFFSSSGAPGDTMVIEGIYQVPSDTTTPCPPLPVPE